MKWPLVLGLAVSLSVVARGADEPSAGSAGTDAVDASSAAAAEDIVLDGVVVERDGGGFMTVTMEGPRLFLKFFDAEKMPIDPEFDRAVVRVRYAGRAPEHLTLIPMGEDKSLTSGVTLRPPWNFKLFITLVRDADGTNELHAVDYPGS